MSVQLGGSFNFVTGEICRAPTWIAGIGLEWLYRFYKEPGRLGPRYLRNWMFLAKAILRDATKSLVITITTMGSQTDLKNAEHALHMCRWSLSKPRQVLSSYVRQKLTQNSGIMYVNRERLK